MLPVDQLSPPKQAYGRGLLTIDDIIRSFLRGELDPGAELFGPSGPTNVWTEILRSNDQTSDGWTLNRCERAANGVSWLIISPGQVLRRVYGPYTLIQLRQMVEAQQASKAAHVALNLPGATCIPLGWLFELPVPIPPLVKSAPLSTDEHPLVSVSKGFLLGVGVLAAAFATYKFAQAALDEDFGDGEFPRSIREELIGKHVSRHGWYCFCCSSKVPPGSLTVDHIVAMRNNGRTSRANAQVICISCNSSKGAWNNSWDYVRGRVA